MFAGPNGQPVYVYTGPQSPVQPVEPPAAPGLRRHGLGGIGLALGEAAGATVAAQVPAYGGSPTVPAGYAPTLSDAVEADLAQPRRTYHPGTPAVAATEMGVRPEDYTPGVGGFRDRARATVVTDAQPVDEKYLSDSEQNRQNESAAMGAQLEAQKSEAQAQAALAHTQALAEQDRAAQAQADQERINQRIADQEGQFSQVQNELATRTIDPQRIFHGSATNLLAGAGAVVASMLGAYAATRGGTPNFAQNIIDNAIQRDIAAQEKDLDTLGKRSNTLLARLDRFYGDRDQAKLAVERLQRGVYTAQQAELVAQTRDPELEAAFQQHLAAQEKVGIEQRHQAKMLERGKVTTQLQQEQVFDQKARGGGYTQETPEQYARRQATGPKRDPVTGEWLMPDQYEARQKERNQGPKPVSPAAAAYEGTTQAAYQAVDTAARAAGLEWDEASKTYHPGADGAHGTGVGGRIAAQIPGTDAYKAKARKEAMRAALGAMPRGLVVRPEEVNQLVAGFRTDDDLAAGMTALRRRVTALRHNQPQGNAPEAPAPEKGTGETQGKGGE
jgi:hypothetical protein